MENKVLGKDQFGNDVTEEDLLITTAPYDLNDPYWEYDDDDEPEEINESHTYQLDNIKLEVNYTVRFFVNAGKHIKSVYKFSDGNKAFTVTHYIQEPHSEGNYKFEVNE